MHLSRPMLRPAPCCLSSFLGAAAPFFLRVVKLCGLGGFGGVHSRGLKANFSGCRVFRGQIFDLMLEVLPVLTWHIVRAGVVLYSDTRGSYIPMTALLISEIADWSRICAALSPNLASLYISMRSMFEHFWPHLPFWLRHTPSVRKPLFFPNSWKLIWGLSQTRPWHTLGQSSCKVPRGSEAPSKRSK